MESAETNSFAEISSELPAASANGIHEELIAAGSETLLPEEELTALPVPEHSEVAAEGPEPTLELPQATVPQAAPEQPEIELDHDFELVLEPEQVAAPHEMLSSMPPASPAEAKIAAAGEVIDETHEAQPAGASPGGETKRGADGQAFTTDQFLQRFLAREIDHLGMGELILPEKNAAPLQDTAAVGNQGSGVESGPLKEVFEEFRAELGEMGAEDEDLETHYNLGASLSARWAYWKRLSANFKKWPRRMTAEKRSVMRCSVARAGLAFMEKGRPKHRGNLVLNARYQRRGSTEKANSHCAMI